MTKLVPFEIVVSSIVNPPIVPPSALIFDAVICPPAVTIKLLADMISSVDVVDEDKTKLVLDSLLVPKVNPPIEPLSVLM